MRETFKEYYPLTKREEDYLWNDGLVVLDANVLLNLYRYSPDTRDELLSLLDHFSDRLWLPHQSGAEFHRNRLKVISAGITNYDSLLKEYRSLLDKIEQQRQHPFASVPVKDRLTKAFGALRDDFEKSKGDLERYHTSDPILSKITDLFAGRVGQPFSESKMMDIAKEGETRYSQKIPPGFNDAKKPDTDKFGDLILWMQILEQSASEKRPVILISDDQKDDWWLKTKSGKVVGPLPGLRSEFNSASGGEPFHMYHSGKFLKIASHRLGIPIDQHVMAEVKDAQRESNARAMQRGRAAYKTIASDSRLRQILIKKDQVRDELADIESHQELLLSQYNNRPVDSAVQRDSLDQELAYFQHQHLLLRQQLRELEAQEAILLKAESQRLLYDGWNDLDGCDEAP